MGPMLLLDRFLRAQSWESGFHGFVLLACVIVDSKTGGARSWAGPIRRVVRGEDQFGHHPRAA